MSELTPEEQAFLKKWKQQPIPQAQKESVTIEAQVKQTPTPQGVGEVSHDHQKVSEDTPKSALTADADPEQSKTRRETLSQKQTELRALLDELIGRRWRSASQEDLEQWAEHYYHLWKSKSDRYARIAASCIWELTANVHRLPELGFTIPWWYTEKGDNHESCSKESAALSCQTHAERERLSTPRKRRQWQRLTQALER